MTDLRAKIVFVVPSASREKLKRIEALKIEKDWRFFEDGVAAWVIQTYLRLRDSGDLVYISSQFSRDALNVSHVKCLTGLRRPLGACVVGVRADYPLVQWCH